VKCDRFAALVRHIHESTGEQVVVLVDERAVDVDGTELVGEGELMMAAELATSESINFMTRQSGIPPCATASKEHLEELGLAARCGCGVSGDTLAERTPHPMQLLHAATLLGLEPRECVYMGDAERDVQAARNAGMIPLVAGFGIRGPEDIRALGDVFDGVVVGARWLELVSGGDRAAGLAEVRRLARALRRVLDQDLA
jgi:hypothetical protein